MSNGTDICGLPVIGGFRLEIDGVSCWAVHRPSREGPMWHIRGPGRRMLGAGRTCAGARRIARLNLRGE